MTRRRVLRLCLARRTVRHEVHHTASVTAIPDFFSAAAPSTSGGDVGGWL
jgi:hypothetical protein